MLLKEVFDGWQGYQESLVKAVSGLEAEALSFRPSPDHQSIGELARHISLGRITWFVRMSAPGAAEVATHIPKWREDPDGNQHVVEDAIPITENPDELARWLELTWSMIDQTLSTWTIDDLAESYHHTFMGQTYANSRQWTLWRILSHDIHHGGELSLMLGMAGIEAFELSGLFGHITSPPLA